MKKTDKILVTGASGFIGSRLLKSLYEQGYTNLRVNLHVRGVRTEYEGVEYTKHDLKTYEGCQLATKDVGVVFRQLRLVL